MRREAWRKEGYDRSIQGTMDAGSGQRKETIYLAIGRDRLGGSAGIVVGAIIRLGGTSWVQSASSLVVFRREGRGLPVDIL